MRIDPDGAGAARVAGFYPAHGGDGRGLRARQPGRARSLCPLDD
jgi:hypothetical protein